MGRSIESEPELVSRVSERWPALMSRPDAARYLGVSSRFLTDLIAEGRIAGVVFHRGGQPRYKRADLDELIESLEYSQGVCNANKGQA
jgi:excisionase family DNA binding protein